MRNLSSLLIISAFITVFVSVFVMQPALADDWHEHGDMHHFHDHDFDRWHAGHWYNGFHEGRNGSWWIVDGSWYFYPAPIYPYPDPYTPPTVVVETPPAPVVGAPPAALYYCPNPAGYYPDVPQCPSAWQKLAPASQQVPAPPPLPAASAQRQPDEQQLDSYAAAFEDIDFTGKRAKTKLINLEKQVDAFHQALYQRNYNAMDIIRNTEDLQHRIAVQKEKLSKPKVTGQSAVAPAPAANTATSAPTSLPPGTAVTFPPQ